MSRLIDADDFIKFMEEKCDMSAELDPVILAVFMGAINQQPTAYDVEKVVEDIKAYPTGSHIERRVVLEIVRKGGINDD